MMENFRTRQNRRSLFPDFRPRNGMNIRRKWDDFRRMVDGASRRVGERAKRQWAGSASGLAAGENLACAAAAAASSLRDEVRPT
jgi:hypothetical protein